MYDCTAWRLDSHSNQHYSFRIIVENSELMTKWQTIYLVGCKNFNSKTTANIVTNIYCGCFDPLLA